MRFWEFGEANPFREPASAKQPGLFSTIFGGHCATYSCLLAPPMQGGGDNGGFPVRRTGGGKGGHDNLSFSVPSSAVTSRRSRSLIPLSDDVRVDDLERRV